MKRWICIFLFACLTLTGCGEEEGPGHLVVQAEVTYLQEEQPLCRCYIDQEKLNQVLTQLRLTKVIGYAREDPETLVGDRCRIVLSYSDGHRSVILLQANRYRSQDYHKWELVDEKQAKNLYPLLKSLPGDVSQTWAWTDSGLRCPAAV